jgi:hypothetical protein
MSLYKIKQPIEYAFLQWMNNFPDSGHWADKERFFGFTKTVCRYKAKKWKKPDYIRKRILEAQPHFDQEFLEGLPNLYTNLLNFHRARAYSSQLQLSKRKVNEGHYIEIRVKNGIISEVELPLDFT